MKIFSLITLLLTLAFVNTFSQSITQNYCYHNNNDSNSTSISKSDTSVNKTLRDYKEISLRPRLALSFQKGFFFELGLSLETYYIKFPYKNNWKSNFGYARFGGYLSNEILIRKDMSIIGPKFGLEYSGIGESMACAYGIEFINYTDFHKSNFSFTPKIGIPLGAFDLHYGYNFLSNNNFFKYVGRNRISLSININSDFFEKLKGLNITGSNK